MSGFGQARFARWLVKEIRRAGDHPCHGMGVRLLRLPHTLRGEMTKWREDAESA